jgi:hypothetical protein
MSSFPKNRLGMKSAMAHHSPKDIHRLNGTVPVQISRYLHHFPPLRGAAVSCKVIGKINVTFSPVPKARSVKSIWILLSTTQWVPVPISHFFETLDRAAANRT